MQTLASGELELLEQDPGSVSGRRTLVSITFRSGLPGHANFMKPSCPYCQFQPHLKQLSILGVGMW